MALHHEYDLIPEGELKCIWMDAGVVDFKLCDLQLRCELCPFDSMVRKQLWTCESRHDSTPPVPTGSPSISSLPSDDYLEQQLNDLLSPFAHEPLPSDRSYSSNHLWFKKEDPLSVTVGLDHLALHVLGPISGIAFTTPPTRAYESSPCAWIIHRNGTLPLRMPIAGTIAQVNGRLNETPWLVGASPYDEGWILQFRPDLGDGVLQKLLSHDQADLLFRKQAEQCGQDCRSAFLKHESGVGTTMYDGGQPVDRIEDLLGPMTFLQIVLRRFFAL